MTNPQDFANEDIIFRSYQEGNESAFKAIVEALNPRLIGWIMKQFLVDLRTAEDVIADKWIKAHLNKEKYKSYEHLKSSMIVSCRNSLIDMKRVEQLQKKYTKEVLYKESEAVEEVTKIDPADQLLQYVKKIGGKTQRAIEMYFFEDKDTKEVANELGISTQTALNLKSRGIGILKKLFEGKQKTRSDSRKKAITPEVLIPLPVDIPEIPVMSPKLPEPIYSPALSTFVRECHYTDLFNRFKQGEREAFRYVFDLYNRRLLLYAYVIEGIDDKEDALADCWETIFRRRELFKSFEHVKNFAFLYLKRYGWNRMKSLTRAKKRNVRSTYLADESEDSISIKEIRRNTEEYIGRIREILKRMSLKGALILELQLLRNWTMSQIRETLGMSTPAVYKCRSLALERLKEELKPYNHLICF